MFVQNVNSYKSNYYSNFIKFGNNYAFLSAKSIEKASSLKSICREILSNYKNNKDLIQKAVSLLVGIKISESALTFLKDEENYIDLSMPNGAQGNLFQIRVVENKKNKETILLDNFNKIVKSFSLNTINYADEKEVNINKVDNFINQIFDTLDEPIFQVRKTVKKTLLENENKPSLNQNSSFNVNQEVTENFVKDERPYIPPNGDWENYSIREIIKQNDKKFSLRPRIISKYDRLKNQNANKENFVLELEKNEDIIDAKKAVNKIAINRGRTFLNSGKVPYSLEEKFVEIEKIYKEIKTVLDNYSTATSAKICSNYAKLKKAVPRGFVFDEFKISFPKNKNLFEKSIIEIVGNDSESVIVLDCNKILENQLNGKTTGTSNGLIALSQFQVNKKMSDEKILKLVDEALLRMRDFKSYIDKKGWYIQKEEPISARINGNLNEKLVLINDRYNRIHSLSEKYSYFLISKVKKSYEKVLQLVKSSRIEFINPMNDNANILFDFYSGKLGNIYKIIKYSDEKILDEVFAITEDGKIIKNVVKNLGIKHFLPTGQESKLQFYTEEELNNNDVLLKLDEILTVLSKEIADYEKYLSETLFNDEMKDKSAKTKIELAKNKITKEKVTKSMPIEYEVVKQFFDKTIDDIKSAVDKIKENSVSDLMLDVLIDDVKNKFINFLEDNKK